MVGAAVAAWLVPRQYWFVRAASRIPDALRVDLTADHRLLARDSSQLSLHATLERALPLGIEVTARPPVAASGDPVTVALDDDDRRHARADCREPTEEIRGYRP